jgi:hypothetical protein
MYVLVATLIAATLLFGQVNSTFPGTLAANQTNSACSPEAVPAQHDLRLKHPDMDIKYNLIQRNIIKLDRTY